MKNKKTNPFDKINEPTPTLRNRPHRPMKYPLKEFEVWIEGYAATGEQGSAYLAGKVEARSFKQACHILMATQYLEQTKRINASDEYTDPDRWDYDPSTCRYWGSRLFDNEADARKRFG